MYDFLAQLSILYYQLLNLYTRSPDDQVFWIQIKAWEVKGEKPTELCINKTQLSYILQKVKDDLQ